MCVMCLRFCFCTCCSSAQVRGVHLQPMMYYVTSRYWQCRLAMSCCTLVKGSAVILGPGQQTISAVCSKERERFNKQVGNSPAVSAELRAEQMSGLLREQRIALQHHLFWPAAFAHSPLSAAAQVHPAQVQLLVKLPAY